MPTERKKYRDIPLITEADQQRFRDGISPPVVPRAPRPPLEFRRSIISRSSSSRSRSIEREASQERQPRLKPSLFQEPIQPANFGPGRRPKSKSVWTVITTDDDQQIIKEKIYTMVPEDQFVSLKDIHPGISIT